MKQIMKLEIIPIISTKCLYKIYHNVIFNRNSAESLTQFLSSELPPPPPPPYTSVCKLPKGIKIQQQLSLQNLNTQILITGRLNNSFTPYKAQLVVF